MDLESDTIAAKASQIQFGRQASLYASSQPHRSKQSLDFLRQLTQLSGQELVLDVGTGVGFAAFAVATKAQWVIATDITGPMLEQAQLEQRRQGIENVGFGLASAEYLPFKDSCFDRVICRTALHHFGRPKKAISEMCRVVVPKGLIVLVDTVSPENNAASLWMNDVERRRDPSHRGNLSSLELQNAFAESGLEVVKKFDTYISLTLQDWTRRSGSSPSSTAALLNDFKNAPKNISNIFNIEIQGNDALFTWPCAILQAKKPDIKEDK